MGDLGHKLKHGVHVMFVSSLVGANLATIALMWATCLSTELLPAVHPRLSQAGLLFPVFLGLDLLFVFVWLVVSWKWTFLPVLGMLSCWGYVRDYCPVNVGAEVPEGSYLVLSYNVANFVVDSTLNIYGEKAVEYIASSNADIICLQECPNSGARYRTLQHKMDSLGYNHKGKNGMCIYSKWPFVGKKVYDTSEKVGNGTFAWRVNIAGDTTLIINNHLQSNQISMEERDEYGAAIDSYDKDKMKSTGKLLLSRLANAASERAEQTDSVCSIIERNPGYGVILAGDLNDTPISYTYQRISDLLKSAYRESGNGLGFSFVRKGFPIRIDHIFVSHDLETFSTVVDDGVLGSDHRPILTRVYKSAK